ncbi:OmcA/MtrC family decaheme c-type cytochrome [Shewanella maritima]|uniref:OmcA/MtrC family decaheme c-type cytochrome n=1 Tax=Shewanella maritima TaxID=2520507 RepID=UPI0037363676
MKKLVMIKATKALLSAGLLTFALTGCGSDGKDGEDGENGPIGSPIETATFIKSTITDASVDENNFLTVTFKLADANGAALYGLTQKDIAAISFGRVGNATELGEDEIVNPSVERQIWLSYYNKDKGDGYFTGSNYFNGSSSECTDCFTDHNDGSYTITVDRAIDTLDKYEFVADTTNGVYMSLKATNSTEQSLLDNTFYYWIPATESVVEKPLQILANSDCQTCHRAGQNGALSFHGSKHTTEEACSFCHTDYNRYEKQDTDSEGNPIGDAYAFDGSIKGMVHSIHNVSNFTDEGIYPQKTSNCQTCHNPDENFNLTDSWKADMDTTACWSCHSPSPAEVAAGVPSSHRQGQNCLSCHSDAGSARGAEQAHYTLNSNNASATYSVTFNSMSVAEDESAILVNFTVTDAEGQFISINQIDPRPYQYGGFNSAIVINGVLNDDYLVNYQKVGYDTFSEEADGSITSIVNATDFDIQTIIEAQATVVLSSQLHVCSHRGVIQYCDEDDLNSGSQDAPYVTSDTFYFNLDGTTVETSPRVQHAIMSDCQQCHTTQITHRYTNDIDGCATCHNGTRVNSSGASSNLATVAHNKHYLYDANGDLFFKKTECQACHGEDGFSINKITADATPVGFGRDADTGETLVVSPQAAACLSCHQPPYGLNETTIGHMESNGGVVGTITQLGVPMSEYEALNVVETCSTCHTDTNMLNAHSNWGGN